MFDSQMGSFFDRVEERYRKEDGKICIEVRVKNELQLFDARDPAPFKERDLDNNFVEYVLASAQSFALRQPLKLVIHISDRSGSEESENLIHAVRSFFVYEAFLQRKHMKRFLRNTYAFLLGGMTLLLVCLAAAEMAKQSQWSFVRNILREGLLIGGWVALWRPLESLMYDWWPTFLKRRYLEKLAQVDIVFRSGSPGLTNSNVANVPAI